MSQKVFKLIVLLGLMCLLFIQPVYAVVRESKIPPNTVLYKSIQTWRDNFKNPWQVIFFKEIKGENEPIINLRLVGFPDLYEFAHPQPLIIKIREDLILPVPDVFASDQESFAPNMGQYDFTPILNQLASNNFWVLELPLKNGDSSTIKIPYFILEEWQKIIARDLQN
ncbi:DUF3122 domain-containing protein [Crocosphaera chwakensis]|uniref:DUF3122 domain-containing protein n=1 Tax=Crocosphaera chwakensis CCY0110 TaxID=391612 RepID=A3IUV7_9CHRO|nr:DUF3122 domain-containing protein [Crocosphaera chwakensis]EAZ89705.1 hypothetical protein CY0110_23161 [Crocosphaera chwakensis CCY0110]